MAEVREEKSGFRTDNGDSERIASCFSFLFVFVALLDPSFPK